ncbi:MAG: MFS transporter [Chloroflexi bacterium]|nr:MFS transporter [Chloroflexota bacterium]MBU1750872.1 MFS transporter [Chloroflexota bacterium]
MTATKKTGWRALPRNVWAVSITSLLTDISSEMVVNLIPLFLANVLGEKTVIIGLIEGIAETTASLLKIFSGWLSDKLGERKWLTVAGYSLSTIAKPFLYFATSWPLVLLVRFADRMGKGIRTAPRDALVADSIAEGQRGLAFGLHRAADTGGAFLGLLIAAIVIWATQAGQVNLTRETFQLVVLLSIVPAVLAVIALILLARDVPIPGIKAQAPRLSLKGFDRRFKIFLVIVVLFTLGNSSDAFLILRAQDLGISTLGILGILLVFNFIYTVISGPAGSLSDRIGRRKLIVGGWLLYGLVYLGFALANAGWQVLLAYAVYGVYYGMVEGTAKALVADVVTPAQRGTAYGVYNAAVGLTAFPASFIAGLLWQGVGPWTGFGASAPFLFGAGLAVLAAGLMAFWLPRLGQESAAPE